MKAPIPADLLSPTALTGVLESVVLREGTDYGAVELSFGDKVARLRAAVERGEAHIVYDADTESVTIVATDQLPR